MFCNKCGAQLPEQVAFCNKCGNQLGEVKSNVNVSRPMVENAGMTFKATTKNVSRADSKKVAVIAGTAVAVILLIVLLVGVFGKSKKDIYGTWTDSSNSIIFTFEKSGDLRIQGDGNFFGYELFQFKKEQDTISISPNGMSGEAIELYYELTEDNLLLEIMDYRIRLHRVEEKNMSNLEENVQKASIHGTWTDSTGIISFTFSENGKLRIAGLEDSLGVSVFTFTEVNDTTIQLQADTDNLLLGALNLNVNYEISGEKMTIEIAGQEIQLIKQ